MASLEDFKVKENKVWFTGGFWPEGVPTQITDVEGIIIEPLYDGFVRNANDQDLWDKDICIAPFGPYLEIITYRTLIERAKSFGTFLYDLGIRKGDVVAIDLPNSINFVIAYVGTLYIGATFAGINPTYKPMELVHALQITDAKVLVLMDALYKMGVEDILPKTKVKHLISTNLLDFVSADEKTIGMLRTAVPDAQSTVPDETEQR